MAINRRKSRVQPKPAKKSYTKKSVDAAYREVQGKMRKEVTKLQKIKTPFDHSAPRPYATGLKKLEDIGMQGRAKRTKAISAAAKKHGVPKSKITALKPINPGEVVRKMKGEWRKKFGR